MDPISIFGVAASSLGLALQLGSTAKKLGDVAGKYKNAKLTVQSLTQSLDILQLTWTQIGQWFEAYAEDAKDGSPCDIELIERVKVFLDTGALVIEAFEKDLLAFDVNRLNFAQRSKLIWIEGTLKSHQTRIMDQTLSMSLFLQAVKLPTPKARAKLLRKSEHQFQKSDESAYSIESIVPSQSSLFTRRRHSLASSSLGSMEYRPLSFENKLFTSRVYIRYSKNMMFKRVFKLRSQTTAEPSDTVQPVPSWESIRNELDADSLLPSSREVSIKDINTTKHYDDLEDGGHTARKFATSKIGTQTSSATFTQACEQGDSILIEALLVGGLDVHALLTEVPYSGYTAVHVAALHGHINVMETLLKHNADVNAEDSTGQRRPLHFAAGGRKTAMVKFLIRQGAQVDAEARNAVQAIHEASWSGSVEVLDALFEAGAALDCSDWLGYRPLHWATWAPNHTDIIKYLANRKAEVDAKSSDGSRAVHLTCRTDSTNLSILLALGAKTNYDDGTDSALVTAINSENANAVEMLLKHGVDPNCRATDGSTALHALASLRSKTLSVPSNDTKICRLLLDHGANLHMKDDNENQVLHWLASHNSTSMADIFAMKELAILVLDQGADIDATNSEGCSPLYLAIRCGNRQLGGLLIRSGSRVLFQTDAFNAELQASNWQRSEYTVSVWLHDSVFGQYWKDISTNFHALAIDDDGSISESFMKENLEHWKRLQEYRPALSHGRPTRGKSAGVTEGAQGNFF